MKLKTIFSFSLITFLFSCGGGGGSSSTTVDDNISINPVINFFRVNNTTVTTGQFITLSWQSTNAISCEAGGDWSGIKNVTGTESIQLNEVKTFNFSLMCKGEAGQNSSTSSVTVIVSTTQTNIYSEDKESYCATPENDSSNYWLEEFDNPVFNENYFTYQQGNGFSAPNGQWIGGWGNNELQYYTAAGDNNSKFYNSTNNTTENLFIEDGHLIIQPIFDNENLFNDPYCIDNPGCDYKWEHTSARIVTSNKVTISPGSEVTVCFKHPNGTGFWPAIWMLPEGFIEGEKNWPYDGENDLVEHMINHQSYETQSTIHFGSPGNANLIYKIHSVPANVDFFDKFHSVTMKWEQDKIQYFLDTSTTPYFTIIKDQTTEFNTNYWPFNEDFYLIINVAVGGNAAGGDDPDLTNFCTNKDCTENLNKDDGRLLIDYIEVKSID